MNTTTHTTNAAISTKDLSPTEEIKGGLFASDFTTGSYINFGGGSGSYAGSQTIAHETSHVSQQGNHNETLVRAKDLSTKADVKGGALTQNHNETLVRAKDLSTQANVKGGGGMSGTGGINHNETLVRAKDLATKADDVKGGALTQNHNETMIQSKDLTPADDIKGGLFASDFTTGSYINFGGGSGSYAGSQTIAHETSHVSQQGNHNETLVRAKDLAPKSTVTGCGTHQNHNETVVRAKDLSTKADVKGGGMDSENHNETLVRAKDLAAKADIKGGGLIGANHNETFVRAKDLATQANVQGGSIVVHDIR